MTETKQIELDRMRYTKNKTSSRLALLAIIFDVLFFVSIYKSDVGSYYYNAMTGISIIYNLLFLLAAFLCSEALKTYSLSYSYVIGIIGVLQIVRIFILPAKAHAATITIQKQEIAVMENAQYIRCILYLLLSGISCFLSSVIGIIRSRKLSSYISGLGEEARRD